MLEKTRCLICKIYAYHWLEEAYSAGSYSWFSHDVTKFQTKKLSILLSFHFHEVLKYPNTFIYTNFRFERVIRFALEDAWISRLLRDAVFSWRPGKLSSGLKNHRSIPCFRKFDSTFSIDVIRMKSCVDGLSLTLRVYQCRSQLVN